MKRLYNAVVAILLILAIAAGIGWIYSVKYARTFYWSRNIRPFFEEQTDGVRGFSLTRYWSFSLAHGRATLCKEYSADGDFSGYLSPPGFPMDEHVADQYRRIWIQRVKEREQSLKHDGFDSAEPDACDENKWWGRQGFGWENSFKLPPYPLNFPGGAGRLACTIPAWAIIFPLLILPAFKLRTLIRRRQRIAAGHCVRCGYDLRASSGRCPECGKVVELAKSAA